MQEACCINFGVMSDTVNQLPRFIPEKDKYLITRQQAVDRFTEHNKKGYIGSIWFGPFPYKKQPVLVRQPRMRRHTAPRRFRNKIDLQVRIFIDFYPDKCKGCKACVSMCQFKAIEYNHSLKRVTVDYGKCDGSVCGMRANRRPCS